MSQSIQDTCFSFNQVNPKTYTGSLRPRDLVIEIQSHSLSLFIVQNMHVDSRMTIYKGLYEYNF